MIGAERVDFVSIPVTDKERAIRVPDVGHARTRLEGAGVEFTGDTFDSGVCQMAFFEAPDGNGLMPHHRYAPLGDGSRP